MQGGAQVVESDGLGDVRRAVVDDHRLAAPGVGRPVAGPRAARLGERLAHEGPRLEAGVHVGPGGGDLQARDGEPPRQVGGNLRRRAPQLLGEREGGEGEVAVLGLRRLHLGADGLHRLADGGRRGRRRRRRAAGRGGTRSSGGANGSHHRGHGVQQLRQVKRLLEESVDAVQPGPGAQGGHLGGAGDDVHRRCRPSPADRGGDGGRCGRPPRTAGGRGAPSPAGAPRAGARASSAPAAEATL